MRPERATERLHVVHVPIDGSVVAANNQNLQHASLPVCPPNPTMNGGSIRRRSRHRHQLSGLSGLRMLAGRFAARR